jgi:hypothetical protein
MACSSRAQRGQGSNAALTLVPIFDGNSAVFLHENYHLHRKLQKRICVDGKSQAFEAEVNNFKCCEEVLFQKIWAVSVHMRRKQQHLFHKNGAWLLHAVFACDRLRPYDPYSSAVKRRFADLSFSRASVKSGKNVPALDHIVMSMHMMLLM